MKNFNGAGKSMAVGQSRVRLLADDKVTKLSRYKIGTGLRDKDLSKRSIDNNKDVISTNRSSRRYAPHDDGGIVGHTAYSLWPKAIIIIFCVLFSAITALPAFGQEADGLKRYDESEIIHRGLVIGDSLPSWFWDIELNVVNHPKGEHVVHFADYKDKLLVLDFWATYCVPCVKSLENWDKLQPEYEKEVFALGIHLYDRSSKVVPFLEKRSWKIPIALGNELDTVLNRLFYSQKCFGQVWIKNGLLLAMPLSISTLHVEKEHVDQGIKGVAPDLKKMKDEYIYRRDGYGRN